MNAVLAIGSLIFELRQTLQTVLLHHNTFFLFSNKSYFSFLLDIKLEITLCLFLKVCVVFMGNWEMKKKKQHQPKICEYDQFWKLVHLY